MIRVADFQKELEAFTGRSWEAFFMDWLYGKGMTDWSVEKVRLEEWSQAKARWQARVASLRRRRRFSSLREGGAAGAATAVCATVLLRQKGDYTEQTVVGFSLDGSENYQVRIPVMPEVPVLQLEDPSARVEMLPDNCVRVVVELPCEPTQVTVDPDQVLLDRRPTNNSWKPRCAGPHAALYTVGGGRPD